MPTNGGEYRFILVGLLLMQLGLLIAVIPLRFAMKNAKRLHKRELTHWKKHIRSLTALIITCLIAAAGFSLGFFFFNPFEWMKILRKSIMSFGCLLSICLYSYCYALFYYHSGLEERVQKRYQRYHIKNWWRKRE
jgi:divalent metal cation (Fe/Co/Zn/Cd) transporter